MSILNSDAAYSSRLSPPSTGSLANNLLSRKRKRQSETAPEQTVADKSRRSILSKKSAPEDVLESSKREECGVFVIKSTTNNDSPRSFRTVSAIPRGRLPLTFVDNSATPTRLFSTHLPLLETDEQTSPHVLIVEDEGQLNRGLHAVERVAPKLYALCKLQPWLKKDDIDRLDRHESNTLEHAAAHLHHTTSTSFNTQWWQKLAVNPPSVPALPSRKAPRLSICRPEPPIVQPAPQPAPAVIEEAAVEADTALTSADDVFARFITQYLETLYLSKTPLGFFTKGPVSRARAVFTSGQIEGATLLHLVQFLRAMIHSSSTTDKKYRDKLPQILQDLPPQDPDEDKSTKKPRKKKLKPDKYGMLQEEADYFAKWWYQDDVSTPSDETAEQSLRRRSAHLRTRETFMQTILILEVLSLESLPEIKDNPPLDQGESQAKKSKSKKADQLSLSLELLVDKLCIWHSLDAGDVLVSKTDKNAREGANQLRSFCVEVIVPFYMSRIPEHATSVNKKLGGPCTSTTTKSRTTTRKPGEPEERKPRRSLHRVATETMPQSAKPTRTLERSATDSQVLPHIKRETPDISLDSIPQRRDSQPALLRRSDTLSKHRLRQREVDFGAIAAANEAKAKKRHEVEQKLKDAISVLKKPSRAVVAGEFADVMEQRKRMAEARARPSAPKRTNSSAAQIAATPKHVKTAAIAATPHHIPAPSFVRPALPPSSGPSLVPSSSIKPKSLSFAAFPTLDEDEDEDDQAIPATDHRPRHRDALAETPSKPKAGFAPFPAFDEDDGDEDVEQEVRKAREEKGDGSPLRESPSLLRTPSKPTRPWIQITPSKPISALALGKKKEDKVATTPMKTVAATPVKNTDAPRLKSTDIVNAGGREGQEQGKSIYDMLGWNDDFED